MSRRVTRSSSKSRGLSPKASIAPSGDSGGAGEGSSGGLIAPRSSGSNLELPKNPDVRPRGPITGSYHHSDEEEDQPVGAKSKESLGTPTTQRTTDPSTKAFELPEKDLNNLKRKTNFPESMILKWHKLVTDYTMSGPAAAHYDVHRRCIEHTPQRLCISTEDALCKIEKVYGEKHLVMVTPFQLLDFYDGACKDFEEFMRLLNKTTTKTNDLDIKLDLMMYMCRNVDDKRARVHKNKLLEMLTIAGDLDRSQQKRVAKDVREIFNSMRSYMPHTDVLEFVHFRRGIKDGEGRLDVDETEAKYFVLTCVPDVVAAILAIANRHHLVDKDLPKDTLKVNRQENDFLERELANKEAESSKTPASTSKPKSSTGASSSKGAARSSKK